MIAEHDQRVTLAWMTANLAAAASVGKLPKLETQLSKGATGQGRQTPQQQRAVLEALSEQLGIRLRKVKRGK